jgi:hypothetical protein
MSNNGRISPSQAPITAIHRYTGQELIEITEDKLRLILLEHVSQIEAKKSWISPLGILIAVITTLCTCTFKDALYLEAAVWKAIFILITIASAIWLVRSIYVCCTATTINDVIETIKQRSPHSDI